MSATPFERFWECYPRKVAKGQAIKTWEKFVESQDDVEGLTMKIVLAINAQSKHRARMLAEGQFVPPWKHPSTWLNGQCWLDELAEPNTPPPRNSVKGEPCCQCARESSVNRDDKWWCSWHYSTTYCNDGPLGLNKLRSEWKKLAAEYPKFQGETERDRCMRILKGKGLDKVLPQQIRRQVIVDDEAIKERVAIQEEAA